MWKIVEEAGNDLADLCRTADAEVYDPRPPDARSLRSRHGEMQRRWVARAGDGTAIGYAVLTMPSGKLRIVVRADWRRRGLGSELLQWVRAAALADGPATVHAWAAEHSAGHGFLAARFDRPRGAEEWSLLDLRGRGAGPADDSLAGWVGPCPTALRESFAQAHRMLEVPPRGSSSVTASLGVIEERAAFAGERWLTLCARDQAGVITAFTQITLSPGAPGVAEQEFTGVLPAARGRGLGTRLKDAMVSVLIREHPDIRYVITQNASDNAPMLAINRRLGFTVFQRQVSWESRLMSPA
ncbi:GNAT family N-acetyltransferase [Actinoplanes sp. NPDC049265]|uniref:GNAT family N-acetyltransferase n=1 Tax=Actinoplanes sp. NPDC049265 TaxID=3363902 RepID=UPI003710511E